MKLGVDEEVITGISTSIRVDKHGRIVDVLLELMDTVTGNERDDNDLLHAP